MTFVQGTPRASWWVIPRWQSPLGLRPPLPEAPVLLSTMSCPSNVTTWFLDSFFALWGKRSTEPRPVPRVSYHSAWKWSIGIEWDTACVQSYVLGGVKWKKMPVIWARPCPWFHSLFGGGSSLLAIDSSGALFHSDLRESIIWSH